MNNPTITGAGPLYAQVEKRLIERINSGEWKPGEIIPGEKQLALDHNVSQGTVRKAITALVGRNLLVRQQGKGTFVSTHDRHRDLFHFFHIIGDGDDKTLPITHTLSCRRRTANRRECKLLGIQEAAGLTRIERLRHLNGRPVLVEIILLPERMFPGLSTRRASELPDTLYELYEREYGITIHRADERLKATDAGARVSSLLDLKQDQPVLMVERVATSLDGTPVELRTSYCNTSHHHYGNTVF